MVLYSRPFKVRLTEHPFILDKATGAKALVGRFDTRKKYRVLAVYGTEQYTDFLLADEEAIFHWVSSEICRMLSWRLFKEMTIFKKYLTKA